MKKLRVCVKDYGEFEIELFADAAPLAVEKVINAAKKGLYNGRRVERLEPGFVFQPVFFDGTDPVMDEMIELEAKTNPKNAELRFERWTVGMAGNGEKSCATQFYVTLYPKERLNGAFTIIGKVCSGFETLEKIEKVDVEEGQLIEGVNTFSYHYPKKDMIIESVSII